MTSPTVATSHLSYKQGTPPPSSSSTATTTITVATTSLSDTAIVVATIARTEIASTVATIATGATQPVTAIDTTNYVSHYTTTLPFSATAKSVTSIADRSKIVARTTPIATIVAGLFESNCYAHLLSSYRTEQAAASIPTTISINCSNPIKSIKHKTLNTYI